jgi:hypothetical protein
MALAAAGPRLAAMCGELAHEEDDAQRERLRDAYLAEWTPSRRPTGCGAPESWPSPSARCTTRSATARSSPTSTRGSTCT